MSLTDICQQTLEISRAQKIEKTQARATEITAHEFDITKDKVALFRTTFDQSLDVTGLRGQKMGHSSGNDFSKEAIHEVAMKVGAGIAASPEDEAYSLCEEPLTQSFTDLPEDHSMDQTLEEVEKFIDHTRTHYPKIVFDSSQVKSVRVRDAMMNSDGLRLETNKGYFEAQIMFSAIEGSKTASFNYVSSIHKKPLKDIAGIPALDLLLAQTEKQINALNIPAGFQGDVVLTPFFLSGFLGSLIGQISTTSLMSGTSLFKDKMNQHILSDKITLLSDPLSEDFAVKAFYSSAGYLNSKTTFFENGVLKNFLLGDYGAKKLKLKRTPTDGSRLRILPGTTAFESMLASVSKGLLVTRFSGGQPSSNGDFSGVAKNSFLIEDGKITRPVKEVMISGNYVEMFKNVQDISRETLNFGLEEFPWIHSQGVHIS